MIGKRTPTKTKLKDVIPECFCRGPSDFKHQSYDAGSPPARGRR